MWTASCIFRLDGILVDSLDVHARVWERIAERINGEQSRGGDMRGVGCVL